jgi:hypothetical protein
MIATPHTSQVENQNPAPHVFFFVAILGHFYAKFLCVKVFHFHGITNFDQSHMGFLSSIFVSIVQTNVG